MQKSMSALEWGMLVVFARVALAAPVLAALVFVSARQMPKGFAEWRPFMVMGLANNVVPMCLIVSGQTQIAGGLAAILNATTPLFTVLLAHLWTEDEKLCASRLVGVLAGFVSVVVMIGPMALSGLSWNLAAQGAVLAAALYLCTCRPLRSPPARHTAADQCHRPGPRRRR